MEQCEGGMRPERGFLMKQEFIFQKNKATPKKKAPQDPSPFLWPKQYIGLSLTELKLKKQKFKVRQANMLIEFLTAKIKEAKDLNSTETPEALKEKISFLKKREKFFKTLVKIRKHELAHGITPQEAPDPPLKDEINGPQPNP